MVINSLVTRLTRVMALVRVLCCSAYWTISFFRAKHMARVSIGTIDALSWKQMERSHHWPQKQTRLECQCHRIYGGLESWVERTVRLTLVSSIKEAYSLSGQQLISFRQQQGFQQAWPIPVTHVMQFCVALKGKGLLVSSIPGKLVALSFASKVSEYLDKTGDLWLQKMLEG